jgi:hypothetical protein
MKSYKQRYLEAQAKIAQLQELIDMSPDEAIREAGRRADVVDLAGIARRMRVERFTPQQWRQRGHLPPVDFPRIKEPLWYAATIRDQFAVPTQRIWYPEPNEYDEELSPVA